MSISNIYQFIVTEYDNGENYYFNLMYIENIIVLLMNFFQIAILEYSIMIQYGINNRYIYI